MLECIIKENGNLAFWIAVAILSINLFLQAVYQVIVLLVLDFWGTSILQLNPDNSKYAVDLKNTLIFNAFVLCQVSS